MVVLMIFAALWHTVVQILVKKTTCIVFANKKGQYGAFPYISPRGCFQDLNPLIVFANLNINLKICSSKAKTMEGGIAHTLSAFAAAFADWP
jgi:hypothetical protein